MSETTPTESIHLGFLTVFREGTSYLGGYLITNTWGRPLEFRLSTAVQPNRVQQLLYGPTLDEYLCADLIGKTLIEKSATPVQLLVTDSLNVLPIRRRLTVPVVAVVADDEATEVIRPESRLARIPGNNLPLVYDAGFIGDAEHIGKLLSRIDSGLDLSEPFTRIREAMIEARKLGVASRAA
jgi:hypothetical protein